MRQGFTSTALAALLMASATPVCAQQAESARRFDIPAGPLARTLPAFARQSGQQILYAFAVGPDAFDLTSSLTWLERFDARATPTSPVVSQLDRPNYPVGLRGRTHLSWTRGPLTLGGAVDHVSDYADTSGRRIGSWTTADLQVRYAPETGPFAGTAVALTIQNLFDRDPPFYDAPEGVAYDAANSDVIGRYVSLQLTRSW